MTLVALIAGMFIGAILLLAWAMLATCKRDADR
jgi:hypothetical protein